jgi:hypothetical protein
MRRQTPIAHLLHDYLFPPHIRTTNDPPSFAAHLARNLVPEVRIEVATFYGGKCSKIAICTTRPDLVIPKGNIWY